MRLRAAFRASTSLPNPGPLSGESWSRILNQAAHELWPGAAAQIDAVVKRRAELEAKQEARRAAKGKG